MANMPRQTNLEGILYLQQIKSHAEWNILPVRVPAKMPAEK